MVVYSASINMILFIFIGFWLLALGSPQYYYINQPSIYHIPTAPNYNQFSQTLVPQSFNTLSPLLSYVSPAPAPPAPTTVVHRSSFNYANNAEYRGFGYQTRTDSGATSHVLFVTGPQAQQINSRIFPNFNSQIFRQDSNINNARTVASEMIDPIKTTEIEKNKQTFLPRNIQDLYAPPVEKVANNDPVTFFQRVFLQSENPSNRVINFYSKDSSLFAEQVPGYPANVVPLHNAINPRFLDLNKTNVENSVNQTELQETKTESEITAESIITNTRFKINDINNTNFGNDDQSESVSIDSESDCNNNCNSHENNLKLVLEKEALADISTITSSSTESTTTSTSSSDDSTTAFAFTIDTASNFSTPEVVKSFSHTVITSSLDSDVDKPTSLSLNSSSLDEKVDISTFQTTTSTIESFNLNTEQIQLYTNDQDNLTTSAPRSLLELNSDTQTTQSSLVETTGNNFIENNTNSITENDTATRSIIIETTNQ